MRIIKNAAWLSGARGFADVASFLLFTAISRAFGPAGTGEYAYAFAVGNLVALIGSSGLEEFGIREYARAAAADRPRLWRNLVSGQARQLIAAAIFFSFFLLSGINHSARASVLFESVVYFVGWYVARTLFVPSMALQAMRLPAVTDLACRLSAVLVAIGLVLGLQSLPLALIGFPVAGLAMVAVAVLNSRRIAGAPRVDAPWPALRTTFHGTLPFAATEVLNQFYARADVLLIAAWLSAGSVGLYAIGVKFVEVGLLPLLLLGTAVYPVIGRLAHTPTALLSQVTRDFVFLIVLLTGWLAVGIATLLPLLVEPVFGRDFRPVIALLPWFALFALTKGGEVALYRLLFCFGRQSWYAASLGVGTVVIVALNLVLIPRFALPGAIAAAIASTAVVNFACLYGLRAHVSLSTFASAAARVALALALTSLVYFSAEDLNLSVWLRALLCCLSYPLAAYLAGLLPDWRHGALFSRDIGASEASTGATASELTNPASIPIPLAIADSTRAGDQPWLTPELLEFTNDAIIIWEMDGRGILYWNHAAERMYGYTRQEAHGQVTHTLLRTRLAGVAAREETGVAAREETGVAAREETGVAAKEELEAALARYGIWIGELSHRTRAGVEVVVQARLALLSQQSDRWLVLEVNRDLSEKQDSGKDDAIRAAVEVHLARLRTP